MKDLSAESDRRWERSAIKWRREFPKGIWAKMAGATELERETRRARLEDRATSVLMAGFYRRMLGEEKESPSAALRAAQLEVWKKSGWKAPYFWAGFIFQDEWKEID